MVVVEMETGVTEMVATMVRVEDLEVAVGFRETVEVVAAVTAVGAAEGVGMERRVAGMTAGVTAGVRAAGVTVGAMVEVV